MTEGSEAHVHHFLIYSCKGLNNIHVGGGGECEGDDVANEVRECRNGVLFAGWAIGGEVSNVDAPM